MWFAEVAVARSHGGHAFYDIKYEAMGPPFKKPPPHNDRPLHPPVSLACSNVESDPLSHA